MAAVQRVVKGVIAAEMSEIMSSGFDTGRHRIHAHAPLQILLYPITITVSEGLYENQGWKISPGQIALYAKINPYRNLELENQNCIMSGDVN